MSNKTPRCSGRQSQKRIRYGVPRKKVAAQSEAKRTFFPGEDWHEPLEGERDGYRIIEKDPGPDLFHPVTPAEIIDRLAKVPAEFLVDLDVVQLAEMTRKKQSYPCYGMQWGTALYLYPVCYSLVEIFTAPPSPALLNETRMYGAKWIVNPSEKTWHLQWTEKTIRDFYLNNILIHELGHLNDDRNSSYVDRERFADWFAIEYGYRPTRSKRRAKRRQKQIRRRHHR